MAGFGEYFIPKNKMLLPNHLLPPKNLEYYEDVYGIYNSEEEAQGVIDCESESSEDETPTKPIIKANKAPKKTRRLEQSSSSSGVSHDVFMSQLGEAARKRSSGAKEANVEPVIDLTMQEGSDEDEEEHLIPTYVSSPKHKLPPKHHKSESASIEDLDQSDSDPEKESPTPNGTLPPSSNVSGTPIKWRRFGLFSKEHLLPSPIDTARSSAKGSAKRRRKDDTTFDERPVKKYNLRKRDTAENTVTDLRLSLNKVTPTKKGIAQKKSSQRGATFAQMPDTPPRKTTRRTHVTEDYSLAAKKPSRSTGNGRKRKVGRKDVLEAAASVCKEKDETSRRGNRPSLRSRAAANQTTGRRVLAYVLID